MSPGDKERAAGHGELFDAKTRAAAHELASNSIAEHTPREVERAILTVYYVLPEVNMMTGKRMAQLDLPAPPPLTPENVLFLGDTEFREYLRYEREREAHPLLKRIHLALDPTNDLSEGDTTAFVRGDVLRINLDKWLAGEDVTGEVRFHAYYNGSILSLRHEDIHRSCQGRALDERGARFLGIMMHGHVREALAPYLALYRGSTLGSYLSEYFDFFYTLVFDEHAGPFTVEAHGASLSLSVDQKVLYRWSQYDEPFVDYELMRSDYGIRQWQKMVLTEARRFPPGVGELVKLHRQEFERIRRWDRSFGNRELARAYFSGELYDLLNSSTTHSVVDLFEPAERKRTPGHDAHS